MEMDLDQLCINTLRFLAVDMVEKANSGHPGLPLGSAPIAYVIWDKFLKYNPTNPSWPDRDRFVLSAGHGCALLYAILHVTGFDLSLDEIKQFRQWGSKTPGHPEHGKAPGVEATTGPLGQGLGNAVGMAMAEAALAAQFNKPDHKIVDHYTYVMVSDGDLMEGLSSEAGSLAGHLRLNKLIVCYSSNQISIEGGTDLAFTENCRTRFDAFGWHTQLVENPYDLNAVHKAIEAARSEKNKPSFIEMRTHIGYGSPHKQDSNSAHGEPLGEEEVRLTKENLGWPTEPTFYIPDEALTHFRKAVDRGRTRESEWKSSMEEYEKRHPDLASEFKRRISGSFPEGWDREVPSFKPDDGPMATRAASGKVINVLAPKMPELIGGSADLAPSTKTLIKNSSDFEPNDYRGRNLRFGVREHIMGAAANGIALHGGFIPYVATFLNFSDYMRPSMRLAALTELQVIYVFTHDSIGLGEDGPTHQPIEQLVGLRAIPNFVLIRPADANETARAWQVALKHRECPVALALTRQNLPVFDLSKYPNIANGVEKGGYIISDSKGGSRPDIILVASGSEVQLILQAQERLLSRGVHARAVSMPSWNLFDKQDEDYTNSVFSPHVPILAVEAGATLGWRPYVGPRIEVIGLDRFGASAPGKTVLEKLGFTVDNVCNRALKIVEKGK